MKIPFLAFTALISFGFSNLALAQTQYECEIQSVSELFSDELQYQPTVGSNLVLERTPNSDSEFALHFSELSLPLHEVLQIDEEDWRGAFRVTWLSTVTGRVYQVNVNAKTQEGSIESHLETGELQSEVSLVGCHQK